MLIGDPQGLFSIVRIQDAVSVFLENLFGQISQGIIVFHQQNRLGTPESIHGA